MRCKFRKNSNATHSLSSKAISACCEAAQQEGQVLLFFADRSRASRDDRHVFRLAHGNSPLETVKVLFIRRSGCMRLSMFGNSRLERLGRAVRGMTGARTVAYRRDA